MDPKNEAQALTPHAIGNGSRGCLPRSYRHRCRCADTAVPPVTRRRRRADRFLRAATTRASTARARSPPGDGSVSGFALDSVRLYVNGSVTDTIKLTFNTEYTGSAAR
jgi:hypothetical protein